MSIHSTAMRTIRRSVMLAFFCLLVGSMWLVGMLIWAYLLDADFSARYRWCLKKPLRRFMTPGLLLHACGASPDTATPDRSGPSRASVCASSRSSFLRLSPPTLAVHKCTFRSIEYHFGINTGCG